MKDRTKKIIAGLIGLVLLASALITISIIGTVLSLADVEPHNDSFSHEISYEFSIETNSTLRNTSFLAPFPQDKEFAKSFSNQSQNTTFSNEFNGNAELVEVNGTTMLRLESDEIKSRVNSNQISTPIELSYTKKYNRSLNTSHGLQEEPAIPVEDRSTELRTPCDSRACYSSNAQVYADYRAENSTAVSISLDLEGWNEWFTTGWSGNQYRQHFSVGYYNGDYLQGSQSSNVLLRGREVQGDGVYREDS